MPSSGSKCTKLHVFEHVDIIVPGSGWTRGGSRGTGGQASGTQRGHTKIPVGRYSTGQTVRSSATSGRRTKDGHLTITGSRVEAGRD